MKVRLRQLQEPCKVSDEEIENVILRRKCELTERAYDIAIKDLVAVTDLIEMLIGDLEYERGNCELCMHNCKNVSGYYCDGKHWEYRGLPRIKDVINEIENRRSKNGGWYE